MLSGVEHASTSLSVASLDHDVSSDVDEDDSEASLFVMGGGGWRFCRGGSMMPHCLLLYLFSALSLFCGLPFSDNKEKDEDRLITLQELQEADQEIEANNNSMLSGVEHASTSLSVASLDHDVSSDVDEDDSEASLSVMGGGGWRFCRGRSMMPHCLLLYLFSALSLFCGLPFSD
ncbi:hypothetical protein L7F22_032790 [Adiantum nelumboides]|nr:hypothetical protein [Adiantum nelumboides]